MNLLGRIKADRGAAVVEFAIVLPILLFSLIIPMIELSHWYNVQISLSNAASVGARSMAVLGVQSTATSQAIAAAPGLNPALGNVSVPATCPLNTTVAVTATYTVTSLTGLWPTVTLTGRGAALCSG